jgi:hypothetical protein
MEVARVRHHARSTTSPEVLEVAVERERIHPRVVAIFTSPEKGKPMLRRLFAFARKGKGLRGDRYELGRETGTYSAHPRVDKSWRNITIISEQGITEANADLIAQGKQPFKKSQTRRNIVVRGVSPEQLRDLAQRQQRIWLGGVEVRLMEEATPCNVPSKQYELSGFKPFFEGRSGVRGTIVNSGIILTRSRVRFS